MAKRLDDFAIHGPDGGLLGRGDRRLRVDKLPELVCRYVSATLASAKVRYESRPLENPPISDWALSRLTPGCTSPPEAISEDTNQQRDSNQGFR